MHPKLSFWHSKLLRKPLQKFIPKSKLRLLHGHVCTHFPTVSGTKPSCYPCPYKTQHEFCWLRSFSRLSCRQEAVKTARLTHRMTRQQVLIGMPACIIMAEISFDCGHSNKK